MLQNPESVAHDAEDDLDGGGFTRDEEALLQSMAVSAGVILRKSQLFEEAIARRTETEALLQITELVDSPPSFCGFELSFSLSLTVLVVAL